MRNELNYNISIFLYLSIIFSIITIEKTSDSNYSTLLSNIYKYIFLSSLKDEAREQYNIEDLMGRQGEAMGEILRVIADRKCVYWRAPLEENDCSGTAGTMIIPLDRGDWQGIKRKPWQCRLQPLPSRPPLCPCRSSGN